MRTTRACAWASFFIGLALLITGIVLVVGNDYSDDNPAGPPLLVVGGILTLAGGCVALNDSSGSISTSTVNPTIAGKIIEGSNRGEEIGRQAAQDNAQQQRQLDTQRQQMQWSINNPN